MYLYDSLQNKKLNLENILKNKLVNIYTCGPTLYDYIHIGNSRPLILTDLLIRFLKYKNIKINYLLNITDIDDKIIQKAIQENKKEKEITLFYEKQFLDDIKKLNLIQPNKILRVTENIQNFIKYIDVLIKQNKAYSVNGNVVFDITKIKSYGKLSNNKLEDLINNKKQINGKYNNNDFVLWKNTNEGINWESPWSYGRPGWHLECAFFIDNYFKKDLTIHIGGMDLKFPHHENERAIFLAKNNSEIAKLWLHNGLLNIKNQKMSKSLDNSFYIKDFLSKYDSNILRYIFYTKKFLQPINIDENIISFAKKELNKIYNLIIKFNNNFNKNKIINDISIKKESDILFQKFINNLEDNLNTANALEGLKLIMKKINISLNKYQFNLILFKKFILATSILGFDLDLKLLNKIKLD